MAFCPHCGKSVTEQAAKCAACNGELEPRGKAVRFKGTMMMSPGTAPLIQPPNAGQPRNTAPAPQPAAPAAAPAPEPKASVPLGTAATMPMPAVGPIADMAAAAATKKPAALKATMMGTGDGGLADILKKVQQPAPPAAAAAPAPAHTPLPTPMPPEPEAAPYTPPPREPAAATRREVQADEDSKRFLVGDPMAPKGGEVPSVAPKAQRNVPRISEEISTELPKDRSATIIVVGIIGVCVIAAIGYVAAKLMGLTN